MSLDSRTEILSFNGRSFNVISCGPDDGEPVLLLHGFPQFADVWSGLMEQLSREGFRAIAFDQRGYSPAARPEGAENYHVDHLTADVLALADLMQVRTFHLIGHDWGGLLAWKLAAEHPDKVRSVSVLSTAHADAFFEAVANDPDQGAKSKYIDFFRMPGHVAESYFLADGAQRLRGVYQGKVAPEQVARNIERLSESGALTAALNWYRALDLKARIGAVRVPSLYIWGDGDMALGRVAATATASYIEADYHFKVMEGYSHWLLEEAPDETGALILDRLRHNSMTSLQ